MTIADLIKSIDRLTKKVNRLENRRINTMVQSTLLGI